MSRKKSKSDMSVDELIQLAQDLEAAQARRNARRRERRAWLKNAPREETALRYRGQEKPCSISIYLQAERRLLRWLPDFPDLQGDADIADSGTLDFAPAPPRGALLVNDLKSGSSTLLMKLACLSLPRMRCQKCPTIHFTYSSME